MRSPGCLVTALMIVVTTLASALAAGKPNILVIVSDDQGSADVGFHGCKDIPTPHLDALARGGVICSNGYVTHPFCSPTRAALMTGRYQQRFGHENNPFYDPADQKEGLPTTERLLPDLLAVGGYHTGWVGKWHLGAAPEFRPGKRGFAESFGFIGGGHRYQNWKPNAKAEYTVPIERNGQPVEEAAHLTTAFGREAAAFVTKNKAKPWFLYLAFNAPHLPHEPTEERLAKFESIGNPLRRKYAAQVSLMDDAIGEVLAAVSGSGREADTLVFFFSDNGGPHTSNGSVNTPLRGGKGDLYEGGVRVPFVVKWPAKLPAGKTYFRPVSSVDVFATALAAAEVAMPAERKHDSVNLVPYLAGATQGSPHERLFWRSGEKNWAIREGDLKFVRRSGKPDELYDLAADPGEKTDRLATSAAEVARLGALLDAWNKELVPPAFPGLAGRKK